MIEEKRNFARLALHANASIHDNNQILEGEVQDVSMKGVFLTAAQQMETNDTVTVTIYNTFICNKKAKVVRVTDSGMGLQFENNLFD